MAAPFNYVSLQKGDTTYKIRTRYTDKSVGYTPYVICSASEGLLEPGENDAEAVEKTFSHGSVLAQPRYAGKVFNIDFIFYSRNRSDANVKNSFNNFSRFLLGGNINLTTDFPHTHICQVQRVQITDQDWKGSSRIVVRVFFKAKEYL